MEAEGRLLHKDWSRYDTAHVVFSPRHMTAEELAEGYAWCYRPALLAPLDLAAAAARSAGGRPISGDVVSLQTVQLPLADADPPQVDVSGMAAAG